MAHDDDELIAEAFEKFQPAYLRVVPTIGRASRENERRAFGFAARHLLASAALPEDAEPDGDCSNPSGHEWVCADEDNGGDGRTYCCWCLADGDA